MKWPSGFHRSKRWVFRPRPITAIAGTMGRFGRQPEVKLLRCVDHAQPAAPYLQRPPMVGNLRSPPCPPKFEVTVHRPPGTGLFFGQFRPFAE